MSHESPGDLAETAGSHLEEAVARMKEGLDRARDDLDILVHKFRDSAARLGELAETVDESAKQTAATCEVLDKSAGDVASATGTLAGELDGLRGTCGASARALATVQNRAEELAERLGAALAQLGDRIGLAQGRLDRAEHVFDRLNAVAGSAADSVGAAQRRIERTDATISALGETLSGVRSGADRARDALAGVADAVDHHEVLPLWREAVDQLHQGTRGIRGIGRKAAAMNAEFDGLMASVKTASEGLATVPDAARAINGRLRGLEPELTSSVAPVRGLARNLAAGLESAGSRTAALSSDLEDAREQARLLRDAMRDATGPDGVAGGTAAPARWLLRRLTGLGWLRRGADSGGRGPAGGPRPARGFRRRIAAVPRALVRMTPFRRKS